MNTGPDDVRLVVQLLSELRALLVSQGEANWLRGINAALAELTFADGELNAGGFGNARSIYRTMTAGGRGFSDYFVWSEDEAKRLKENQRLDELRSELWKAFGL
jgi:hypothetical protein